MDTGALSLRLGQYGREADHSPPSSAEIKNGGAIPPLHYTYIFMTCFTFTYIIITIITTTTTTTIIIIIIIYYYGFSKRTQLYEIIMS
jgi:hypothetical protein